MRKKYKVSIILALIGSTIAFLFGLIGLIAFLNYDLYAEYFNLLLNTPIIGDTTLNTFLKGMSTSVEDVAVSFYIITVIMNIFSTLLAVPGIVFSIIGLRYVNSSTEDFQSKTKFHIWRVIAIGLAIESLALEMFSYLDSTVSTISSLANIVLIIALIFGIIALVENKRLTKKVDNAAVNVEEEPVIIDVNVEQSKDVSQENTKEETYAVDQSKLDEMYDLLAKLEKSYRKGDISFDDYQRMKQTILDNYMK